MFLPYHLKLVASHFLSLWYHFWAALSTWARSWPNLALLLDALGPLWSPPGAHWDALGAPLAPPVRNLTFFSLCARFWDPQMRPKITSFFIKIRVRVQCSTWYNRTSNFLYVFIKFSLFLDVNFDWILMKSETVTLTSTFKKSMFYLGKTTIFHKIHIF